MSTKIPDIRGELVSALKGAYVDGFHFSSDEDENQTVASLTNPAVRNYIALDDDTTNLIIGYTLVKNKESAVNTVYKVEILKAETKFTLVVRDIVTDSLVNELLLPELEKHELHDEHSFDSIEECIAEFDGTDYQISVQAEANRTCEDQLPGLLCCLNNGMCFSVHLFVKPTAWKCRFAGAIPNSGVFVRTDR